MTNDPTAWEVIAYSMCCALCICAMVFIASVYYMQKKMEKLKHVCKFDLNNGKIIRIGEEYQDKICVYSRFCWEYKCKCGKVFHSDSWPQMIGWVHYEFRYKGKKVELNTCSKQEMK
jgi:hypothetical protein